MKMVILILVIMSLMVGFATGEVITGTIGGTTTTQTSVNNSAGALGYNLGVKEVYINNIQYSTGTASMVHFDAPGKKGTFSTGSPIGETDTFIMHKTSVSGPIIATGTAGYQRRYNDAGTEIEGFQYLVFSKWETANITTGTLYAYVVLSNPTGPVYNMSLGSNDLAGHYGGNGDIIFAGVSGGNAEVSGITLRTIQETGTATYTLSKPSGIGITGNVSKIGLSRIYVLNGTAPFSVITNDNTPNTNTLNVTTTAETITVNMQLPSGSWYNSSVLFLPGTGVTVTPTPAPTIPAGYIRTTVHAWDSMANAIHGATIDILDIEANIWTNSTNDADGVSYIDTLPYHHLNIYGSFDVFPGEFTDAELLNVETGYIGTHYYLTMYPGALNPGLGKTNLFVTAYDADDNGIIRGVSIQARLPSGATYGENTGTGGTCTIVVPNNTTISVSASKSGYLGATVTVNSGAGLSYAANLIMHKETVTPAITRTVVPGEATVRPTMDGRTGAQKDQAMMDLVRNNGEGLIGLAILVTFLSLFGLMRKGM